MNHQRLVLTICHGICDLFQIHTLFLISWTAWGRMTYQWGLYLNYSCFVARWFLSFRSAVSGLEKPLLTGYSIVWYLTKVFFEERRKAPNWLYSEIALKFKIKQKLYSNTLMFAFAKEIQSNLSLRTPLYYGQFVWSQKCQKSYIPYLYNTDTSVKRTLGSVPLVPVLERFDCITCAKWL